MVLPALVAASLWSSGCSLITGSAGEPLKPKPRAGEHRVLRARADDSTLHPAELEKQTITINVAQSEPPPREYVIGHNDVLHVNVVGRPELGSMVMSGLNRVLGTRVDGSGHVQLPQVGLVRVEGMTLRQVQQVLQEHYRKVLTEPWVVVEIVEYRSQPLYLMGDFNAPGVYYLDRPTNVLQAMALAQGVKANGNLRSARIMRNNRVLPVDLYRLLREGAFEQNVWLKPNDTIYIPDAIDQVVYVVGNVRSPGAVPMPQGRLTLPEALARVGGPLIEGGDWRQIRIIRSLTPTRGELIVVDYQRIIDGESLATYPLAPGDIVYLPKTALGEWNDVMREILPTIRVIGGVVQPFAAIATFGNND